MNIVDAYINAVKSPDMGLPIKNENKNKEKTKNVKNVLKRTNEKNKGEKDVIK